MASCHLYTTFFEGNFGRIYYNESYVFLFSVGNEKDTTFVVTLL